MSARWIRATLDDLELEVQHLRELGRDDVTVYPPFPVEPEEGAFPDRLDWLNS